MFTFPNEDYEHEGLTSGAVGNAILEYLFSKNHHHKAEDDDEIRIAYGKIRHSKNFLGWLRVWLTVAVSVRFVLCGARAQHARCTGGGDEHRSQSCASQ